MLKVAIIGFGGIAKAAHLNPYLQLQKDGIVKLVAVCDVCPEQFTEKAEINIGESDSGLSEEVNKYTDYKEMLQKESVDMMIFTVFSILKKTLRLIGRRMAKPLKRLL